MTEPPDHQKNSDHTEPATDGGELQREAYFPTFIFYRDLAGGKLLNDEIKPYIYAWRDADKAGIVRSNVQSVGAWHSAVDMNQRPEYRLLCELIVEAAQAVFDDLAYDPNFEPAIDNMWVNVSPRYGYNRNHVHPNALWSGVYYVQAPPGAGRIFFSDPRPQVPLVSPRFIPDQPRRSESWTEVFYEAIGGRLIMFPSWLVHEVEPNITELEGPDADRISVSFNLVQRRRATQPGSN